jgi:predicted GIY-YIG superfamily endonuclease
MTPERKADIILHQAKKLAKSPTLKSWVDFSSAIFDPKNGAVAKHFPSDMERRFFTDSKQYKDINDILHALMKKFGVANGAVSEKSGRFVVRVPKSVHTILEVEARHEGVSLNQLAVAKLSSPLADKQKLSAMLVAEAFAKVHDGYSSDRVVVDPDLNGRFVATCRKLGLNQTAYALNHYLLDLRKSGKHHEISLPKTTKRTEFRDYDEFQFAVEIAIRVLQRTEGVTLDRLLCDPEMALEFDKIAKQLAPGQSSLKLRYGALNLRKTHRLGPSKKKPIEPPQIDLVNAGPLQTLQLRDLPEFPAAYVIYDMKRPIFAGETENLRRRTELHLKGGLPKWIDNSGSLDLVLKKSEQPSISQETRLAWLTKFVNDERPLLNYQKVA